MSCAIERFVILLYDRTSTCTGINKTRKKLYAMKNNVQLIPPTKVALKEHDKRAAYLVDHVLGQTLRPGPEKPPPTRCGGPRPVTVCSSRTGPHYLMRPRPAVSLCLANARRVV